MYGSTEHPTVTYVDKTMSIETRAFTDGRIDSGNAVRIVDDGEMAPDLGEPEAPEIEGGDLN